MGTTDPPGDRRTGATGRRTRQREALWAVFLAARRPLTPGEILAAARRRVPTLGMATVYRGLQRLLRAQRIAPVILPGEGVRYERSDLLHHHHFRCDACARVFDVRGCSPAIEQELPKGFRVRSHSVSYTGTCADCNRPGRGNGRRPAPGAGRAQGMGSSLQ